MDRSKQSETIAAMIEARHASERRLMGARMVATVPSNSEDRGVLLARYAGNDPDSDRRFATLIAVATKDAWSFFLEGPHAENFDAFSDEVFDAVELRR